MAQNLTILMKSINHKSKNQEVENLCSAFSEEKIKLEIKNEISKKSPITWKFFSKKPMVKEKSQEKFKNTSN